MFAIDLTWSEVIVSCHKNSDIKLWSFPWTAAFSENDDSVIAFVGEKDIVTEEKTAVFHDLRDNFHRIYDHDIQTEIIAQLLHQIKETAQKYDILEDTATSVVIPYGYSSDVLNAIEAGFQQDDAGLRLSGWFNECVAAIIYFFEISERVSKWKTDPSGEVFCFINATMLPVRAFLVNYKEVDNERILVVKDYYSFDNEWELSWQSIPELKTVIFGNPELVKPVGEVIDHVISKDRCRVMVAGAMILGTGNFKSGKIYSIEGALNFGIQIDSSKFYQIIPKELLLNNAAVPLMRSKAFVIDRVTHDVNLNLYCGFSDRLDGAVNLGTITLVESQLPRNRAEIVISVELESMHSGKFSAAIIPQKAEPIVKSFSVPGWLG